MDVSTARAIIIRDHAMVELTVSHEDGHSWNIYHQLRMHDGHLHFTVYLDGVFHYTSPCPSDPVFQSPFHTRYPFRRQGGDDDDYFKDIPAGVKRTRKGHIKKEETKTKDDNMQANPQVVKENPEPSGQSESEKKKKMSPKQKLLV